MSLPNEVISGLLSSAKDEDKYQVSRSLRFNMPDVTYLSKTHSASDGNRKTWTFSCWFKKTKFADIYQSLFSPFSNAPNSNALFLTGVNTDNMEVYFGNTLTLVTTQVFRDPSAWYHIVYRLDVTQATASNRFKIYINGSEITSFTTDARNTALPQNTDTATNMASQVGYIGSYNPGHASRTFSGYMSEVYFIDGLSLDPTSFAQSDANGRWVPKAYTGTYGTNGFYLNFSDNSGTTATTLGKDSSGNGNNWTPNNFSVTAGVGNDSLVDSPTNYGTDTGLGGEVRGNYATFSPINTQSCTPTNGNLYCPSVGYFSGVSSSIVFPQYDKWYVETLIGNRYSTYCAQGFFPNDGRPITQLGASLFYGTVDSATTPNQGLGVNLNGGSFGFYATSGTTIYSVTEPDGTSVYSTNELYVCHAIDFDNKRYWVGTAFTTDSSVSWFGPSGIGANPTISSTGLDITNYLASYTGGFYFAHAPNNIGGDPYAYVNFGQSTFKFRAPTNFKCLCTTNLQTPTIKKSSQYMNIATYTGTGATRSITGVGFQPDLVWTKSRSNAETHKLVDSVRGATKALSSDTTGDEVTESGLTSFDSDGFTVDGTTDTGYNTNTYTYVGWAWKIGRAHV